MPTGQASTLTLNLTLSASLAPSETLSVLLPGFTLSPSPSTPLPLSLTTDPPDILTGVVQMQASSAGLLITLTARVAFQLPSGSAWRMHRWVYRVV